MLGSPFAHFQNISSIIPIDDNDTKNLFAWFAEAPKFTTYRVNSLQTTEEDVLNIIKDCLQKAALAHNAIPPIVYRHKILTDCVVVGSWNQSLLDAEPINTEVIVDAACGAAVLRGADVFAPGVLGTPHVEEGCVVRVYADVARKCLRGRLLPYPEEGKVFIGCGVMRMSRKDLFEGGRHPNGIAIEILDRVGGVPRVQVPKTLALLQNLPSILCCHVLQPQPGQTVLDMCAAPGNKTTHIATFMQDKGEVIALDKAKNKVDAILALCKRFSVTCVKAFVYDSTKAVSETTDSTQCPPFLPCTFNCVLLDAPCSALGQRPQLVNHITEKQIKSYPPLQKQLFRCAVSLLQRGGTLVYSTCTMTMEENEDVVSWALQQFSQLTLVPAEPFIGQPGIPKHGLPLSQCRMVQRFSPPIGNSADTDTIGFFVAKFVKA